MGRFFKEFCLGNFLAEIPGENFWNRSHFGSSLCGLTDSFVFRVIIVFQLCYNFDAGSIVPVSAVSRAEDDVQQAQRCA